MTEFIDAMRAAGLDPSKEPLIADGLIHRFAGPGDKRGRENCWYVLFEHGGAFGSWRLGIQETWRSQRNGKRKLSSEARRRIDEEIKTAKAQAEVELRKLQAEAAAKAKRLWSIAIPISDPSDHPYLARKRVQPHGVRRLGNALCLRIRDAKSETVNLQFIKPDGQKRFIAGGKVSGCYSPIADSTEPNLAKIAIAEGFATAATIHEAAALPTAVAFSANNLVAVAKMLRRKHRNAEIIVCGDDDCSVDGNPGVTKAREAAEAVDGRLVIPAFPENVLGSDFNDLACAVGLDAVRDQIAAVIDDGIPANFRLANDTLYLLRDVKDKNGKLRTEERPVCSRLEVVALTRSVDGNDWGRLLRFRDSDRRTHEWAMPMEMLSGDGADYRATLLNQGLLIFPDRDARYGLHEYLARCQPKARARAVNRIGWHDTAFVLPDETFADSNGERVLYQSVLAVTHAFNVCGTLEDWQCEIAARCIGNSRLIFAVSAAFAPPLLYLVNAESGGFHLVGPSSRGKTTGIRVAGSVWGGSSSPAGYLRQWRATANGLEGVASLHCDALLCLDELSEVNPREAGSIAYMLANGSGKTRARRDGSARTPYEWRSLFLSTGEITLADKVKEEPRQRATAGQGVRVLDVPAEAGPYGLFENLHGAANPQDFADQLKQAVQKHYGTPIRAFLAEIVRQPAELEDAVRKHQAEFLQETCDTDAHGQIRRAAARFGLVAAVGELATALGITGWPEGAATEAARRCFDAYLKMRGHAGAAEIEAGIEHVRQFFIQRGGSRFAAEDLVDVDSQGRTVLNRAGFKRGDEYCVFPEIFRNEIASGFDWRALADALAERGLIRRDKQGNVQCPVKVPGTNKSKRMICFSPDIVGETIDEEPDES